MVLALVSLVLLVGAGIHARVTHAHRHRTIELLLVWWMVGSGVLGALGGAMHLGPTSTELAERIGYEPSMFQWEVGWGDIAVGLLGVGVLWRRDGWVEAAVLAWAVSYWGDTIGHVMQWVAHDNTEPDNIGVIPGDILGPLLAIGLLIAYRRTAPRRPSQHAGGGAPDDGLPGPRDQGTATAAPRGEGAST